MLQEALYLRQYLIFMKLFIYFIFGMSTHFVVKDFLLLELLRRLHTHY